MGARVAAWRASPSATAATAERLDELRAAYVGFYAEAEAVAQSSIAAARRSAGARAARAAGGLPLPALWLIRRIPPRWRRRVPTGVRHGIVRALRSAPAR